MTNQDSATLRQIALDCLEDMEEIHSRINDLYEKRDKLYEDLDHASLDTPTIGGGEKEQTTSVEKQIEEVNTEINKMYRLHNYNKDRGMLASNIAFI